eukprot:gene12587-16317_t
MPSAGVLLVRVAAAAAANPSHDHSVPSAKRTHAPPPPAAPYRVW